MPANTSIYTGADGAISLSVPQGKEGDTAQGVLTSYDLISVGRVQSVRVRDPHHRELRHRRPDIHHVSLGGVATSAAGRGKEEREQQHERQPGHALTVRPRRVVRSRRQSAAHCTASRSRARAAGAKPRSRPSRLKARGGTAGRPAAKPRFTNAR